MALPSSVILVCTGADTASAAYLGYTLLDLCYGINAQGALCRTKTSSLQPHNYIGVAGSSLPPSINEKMLAEQLVYEAQRLHTLGVFVDIEGMSPEIERLCSALDDKLHQKGLSFFLPAACGAQTNHAVITAETALSGGSLSGMMSEYQQKHGEDRVAALLRPVSADFCLPSGSPDGVPLTTETRESLREKAGSQLFYSKELCAKYFTYMDEKEQGHFVLFDDDSTLHDKITQLEKQGIRHIFALYPDVKNLL